MKTIEYKSALLGTIVTEDFRAASILKEAGIDFCCGGSKSLDTACREKDIPVEGIVTRLQELENVPASPHLNYKDWEPGFLADYIVNTHHSYVKKMLPELEFYTAKIAGVHGQHHPELIQVAAMFRKIMAELTPHLQQEEQTLFPAIKALIAGDTEKRDVIRDEIRRMKGEHEFAGTTMDFIRQLTLDYTVPEDGCQTYRLTFQMLEAFEDDLHTHVHLENNILYPAALKL
jgi:regulator of cell morphogenesis and NO signaling